MPADARRARTFLLTALAWSLALFGLLRTPWVEERLVLPLTRWQAQAAEHYAGRPTAPIAVTAECSGTDALALCLAAILACPVPWRARLAGAAGGAALILAVNTLRIAVLGRTAASPAFFQALHLHVFPALLVLAGAGYVLAWMRSALHAAERTRAGYDNDDALSPLLRRLAPRAVLLLAAFALAAPLIARSTTLLAAGAWTAQATAFLLAAVGLDAAASGNVLTTGRGAFVVTPECLASALVPLYVAGVFSLRLGWPRRALALTAALPLFTALAVARLLVLALPPALATAPLFVVHGFHQFVLAVGLVVLVALWREPPSPRRRARVILRAGASLGLAWLVALVFGAVLTQALLGAARALALLGSHTFTDLATPGDEQGALALLPAYQAGLLLALGFAAATGWRRLLAALGLLLASQVVLLVLLGELRVHAGLVLHALLLRAWAVGVPVVFMLVLLRAERPLAGMLASPRRPAADAA